MPIYIYRCRQCEAEEEIRRPIEHLPPLCHDCKIPMRQVYGTFTFVMSDKKRKKELTGWRKSVF